jgi:hypothetical protein
LKLDEALGTRAIMECKSRVSFCIRFADGDATQSSMTRLTAAVTLSMKRLRELDSIRWSTSGSTTFVATIASIPARS